MKRQSTWLAAAAAIVMSGVALRRSRRRRRLHRARRRNPGAWETGGTPTIPLHFIGTPSHGRPASGLPLDTLEVPRGFRVEVGPTTSPTRARWP